jgi:hypothetical protein
MQSKYFQCFSKFLTIILMLFISVRQEPYQSYYVFGLPSVEVVCVYAERDYGFVGIDHKGLKCSTCNFNPHACGHVKFLEEKINQDDVDFPCIVYEMYQQTKKQRKAEWKPCCMSDKSIPFHPPVHLQHIFGTSFYQSLPQEDGTLLVVPRSGGVCGSCGSSWSLQNPVVESWVDKRVLLYAMNKIYPCTSMCVLTLRFFSLFRINMFLFFSLYVSYIFFVSAFYVKCSNDDCEKKLLMDGEEIGVINMKHYLIAHEVLRDYMYHFLYARFVPHTILILQ